MYFFSGCAGSDINFNHNPNKDYSFVAQDGDTGIENPPANKARIYAFRKSMFAGSAVRYNMLIHSQAQAQNGFNEGYFFGFSRPGGALQMDIVPSNEPIYISGKTEARVAFSFTPRAGKIYCVASGVSTGFFIGRPAFTLVEKQVCQKYITQYLSEESRQQWLEDKAKFERVQPSN